MKRERLAALLKDCRRAGIHSLAGSSRPAIRAAAEGAGLSCCEVSFDDATGVEAVLAAIGRDLGFPAWYGANLDALKDCLTDLSWHPAAGYVLLVVHAERLCAGNPAGWAMVNEVFAEAVAEWRERDVPMWVLHSANIDPLLARFPGA